jgi:hypothetical protein
MPLHWNALIRVVLRYELLEDASCCADALCRPQCGSCYIGCCCCCCWLQPAAAWGPMCRLPALCALPLTLSLRFSRGPSPHLVVNLNGMVTQTEQMRNTILCAWTPT